MKTTETTYKCSCGCGKTAKTSGAGEPPGWFTLDSADSPSGNDLRLLAPVQFSGLACLGRWVTAAIAGAPRLEAGANERPRGTRTLNDVEGLCV